MLTTKKAVKTVGFMVFAVLAGKLLGQAREILFAGYYGTDTAAKAFTTASSIPLYFFDIGLGAAISSAFIPVFNRYLQAGERDKAESFANSFINAVLLVCGLLTLIGVIFAGNLVGIIASGYSAEEHTLAVFLVRILFPMIIFTGLAFSFVAILQSLNEFNIPAIISIPSNIIVLLYLALLNRYFGITGLAVTMLAGWLLQALIQVPWLIKKGYRHRLVLNLKDEGIRKAGMLMVPILISTWVQPVNAMVNMRLASYLNQGEAVPALGYANKLYIIIVGVFTYALTNLIFPSLSRLSAEKDRDQFARLVNTALRTVVYFIFPLMIGFIVLSTPVVSIVYERGAFDASSTALTASALFFYSMGMLGFSIQEVLNKGFFALHDASTPMKISAAGITLNILLSFLLFRFMGIGGLALAASIAATAISSALLLVISRRVKGIIESDTIRDFFKVAGSSVVMGILAAFVYRITEAVLGTGSLTARILETAISGGAGVLAYAVITVLLGVKESRIALGLVSDIFKRK